MERVTLSPPVKTIRDIEARMTAMKQLPASYTLLARPNLQPVNAAGALTATSTV
jgi:hypothetical protein